MAKILINEAQLSSIADSIREKWWLAGSMPVSSIAECLSSIMTTSEYIAISNSTNLSFPILREVHGGAPWNPNTISLPNITKIGDYAFYSCRLISYRKAQAIISQMVANGGSEIGDYAFYDTINETYTNYRGIDMNLTGITKIGNNAFYSIESNGLFIFDLYSLTYLGTGLRISNFSSYNTLTSIELNLLEYIGNYAFYSCRNLSSIDIHNCNYIGKEAFYSCSNLSYVSPILNCSYIDTSAFYNCSKLSSIDASNCSYIGDSAFYYCRSLSSISLPNCSYIGKEAFHSCTNLSYASLPNVSYIGNSAFR